MIALSISGTENIRSQIPEPNAFPAVAFHPARLRTLFCHLLVVNIFEHLDIRRGGGWTKPRAENEALTKCGPYRGPLEHAFADRGT